MQANVKYIYRKAGKRAWIVRTRSHGQIVQKQFADAKYSGTGAAFKAALAYRDGILLSPQIPAPDKPTQEASTLREVYGPRITRVVDGYVVEPSSGSDGITRTFPFHVYGSAAAALANAEAYLAEACLLTWGPIPETKTTAQSTMPAPSRRLTQNQVVQKIEEIDAKSLADAAVERLYYMMSATAIDFVNAPPEFVRDCWHLAKLYMENHKPKSDHLAEVSFEG